MAGSTSLHILANYNLPLNRALAISGELVNSATKTILILMVGAIFLTMLSRAVWKPYVEKQEKYISDSQLAESINQMNDNLPLMVDDITRIDSIEVNGRNVIYNYTMLPSVEITEEPLEFEELRLVLLNEYCFSKENSYFSTVNVSVTSVYRDTNGKEVNTFTIKPEECKNS